MTKSNLVKKMSPQFAVSAIALALSTMAGSAQASSLTMTSPAGGVLPNTVSEVGGVVLDLVGTNNARVVSQLPASTLFEGFYDDGEPISFRGNPGTIGIQTGFGPSITRALGGGLQAAAIRITLYDGDTARGNFDFNGNTLLVNGLNFGNFSTVNAQQTDSTGNAGAAGLSGGGFRNNRLDTGFFSATNPTLLTDFFNSLVASEQVRYQLSDSDVPYDNFFDFTQGVDSGLINVGQPPTTAPTTPVVPPVVPPVAPPPVVPPVSPPSPTPVPGPEFSPVLSLLTLGAWGAVAQLKRKRRKVMG